MKPYRVQRKRTKGWRLPPNTVCVDRSTRYGNPFEIITYLMISDKCQIATREDVVRLFDFNINRDKELCAKIKKELKGKNLACWCALDKICHADILLKIANDLT